MPWVREKYRGLMSAKKSRRKGYKAIAGDRENDLAVASGHKGG